ncbi:MAG TPA: hypothetical protein VEA60_16170 [Allosphingosinicella sp.]|nr:hypothetical protein [Allosphingosinicella sp.]
MKDARPDAPDEPPMTLSETVDLAMRRLSIAIVAAAAIVGIAIYKQPGPPRFEAFAVGGQIVRVDTRKGTIIACEGTRVCQIVLQRGQRANPIRRSDSAPAPAIAPPAAPAAEK